MCFQHSGLVLLLLDDVLQSSVPGALLLAEDLDLHSEDVYTRTPII